MLSTLKISLIRPSTITTAGAVGEDAAPPLGLAYIAAMCRSAGFQVQIIDALGEALGEYNRIPDLETGMRHGLSDEQTIKLIDPDTAVIGVSCMFSLEWPFVKQLIKSIKRVFPDKKIVVGGEHITAIPKYSLLDCPEIDYAVLGEGERTFLDMMYAISNNKSVGAINGIAYIDKITGEFRKGNEAPRIRQIKEIPWPAWDLVPIENYLNNSVMTGVDFGRSMPIMASRGCPYECTFCSNPIMFGRLWKVRPPEDVVDEIEAYMQKYRATNFDFYDLTAIVKRSWIIEFCELLKQKKLDITWQLPSGTRSEAIDKEVTKLLSETGCKYINYAPESGSERVLVSIKKKITKKNMLKSIKHAAKNGLNVKSNFILGFPDDEFVDVLKSYIFAMQMALVGAKDVSFFPFSPYPGSGLFYEAVEDGEIVLNDDYFISLSQYTDPKYAKSYAKNFSANRLKYMCLVGMGLFYAVVWLRNPMHLIRTVRQIFSMRGQNKLSSALVRVIKKRKEISLVK